MNVTFPEARKMVSPPTNQTSGRITYSAMTHSTKTMATVGTQTDIVHCKCQVPPKQTNNTNSKDNTTLKQASNQTEDIQKITVTEPEEGETSSQQKDPSWNLVGRSRTISLSPRNRTDNRGRGGLRGKAGEPPDKQPRGSQSPGKSLNRTKGSSGGGSLGATATGGQSSLQGTRKQIEFPS